MRHFYAQMSPARHQQILDEARAAGRRGATRVPDTVLFGDGDPSDSLILRLVDAHADGYAVWLAENADRLSAEVAESGCDDGGKWLRQQYVIETGKAP